MYDARRRVVEGALLRARPKSGESTVEVGTSQMDMMMGVCDFFLTKEEDIIADLASSMDLIRYWSVADRDVGNANPVQDDFFPCVIRGYGESEFALGEPPAVLTQYGADAMLSANAADPSVGISPDDFGSAFLTNIATSISVVPTEGGPSKCVVNGVELEISDPSARGVGAMPSSTAGISYTESWVVRWSEARRYTPFHLTSSYSAWVNALDLMSLSWPDCRSRGAGCLLTGTLYLACEWACRYGVVTKGGDDDGLDGLRVLKAWRSGNAKVKIPKWMGKWRAKMSYHYKDLRSVGYPSTNPVGLLEWSRAELAKAVGGGDLEGGGVVVEETRMPFIERGEGGYPLQDAALTTMGPLRFWLCFSLAIETTGSCHLDALSSYNPFQMYYQGVLRYLGAKPGKVGRKLGKNVAHMYRLLASRYRMAIPNGELPTATSGAGAPLSVAMRDIDDRYALALLRENFDVSGDRLEVAQAISKVIPELEDGLMAIYMEFMGSPDSLRKYAVTSHNAAYLDALTHLAHAGSAEGYSRSCLGSLPVKGYKSHAQRVHLEGIDSSVARGVDDYERAIWDDILEDFRSPSSREVYNHMWALSNSRSAGGDRIRFKSPARLVVDSREASGGDKDEPFMSNRKDVMHFTAALLLRPDYLKVTATPDAPFPVGLRSVAARTLRYIYNLPITQQIIMRPLYIAIKTYMKYSSRGYAIEQRIGVPVADARECINASLMLASDPSLMCVAVDASGLDQHIGPAHRRVWIESVLKALSQASERDGFGELFPGNDNLTYGELVRGVLQCWDDSYYVHNIVGAPSQLLHVDTQPSGAITTGSDNTVVTMAMLDLMSAKTGHNHIREQVWGDDCFAVVKSPGQSDEDVIGLIRSQEEVAKGAGQVVGTIKDSTSGRMVHFLQILYIGGQAVSRRMSYDHETPQLSDRMPGAISEYYDKATKLASRGGNAILLNMLQLMTMSLGSYSTIYGRQAVMDFDSMVAPGGSLNRVAIGFGLPSSKLYLELHRGSVVSANTEELSTLPKLETPQTIGARVVHALMASDIAVQIGGVESSFRMAKLVDSAGSVLLDKARMHAIPQSQLRAIEAAGLSNFSYANAVKHGGEMALGNMLRDKRLKTKFKEKALIENGFIGTRAQRKEGGRRNKRRLPEYRGIRIGRYTLSFTMDSGWFIVLPQRSSVSGGSPDNQYRLISPSGDEVAFSQRWHPYYSQPTPVRMVLGLTGVHAGRDMMDVKSGVTTFSASSFRNDLMPESIMDAIMKLRNGSAHLISPFLKMVGFSDLERASIMNSVDSIPLIRDISTSSEYSSLTDLLKSAGLDRIFEIFSLVCPDAVGMISSDAIRKEVFFSHWLGLLYEEINVADVSGKLNNQPPVALRVPSVLVS
jgi:hypothetical protein